MSSGESPRRVAVVGGGISGLTAAYTLARARQAGVPIEEFLFESSDRLGGSVLTEEIEGFVVEAGPDSFLTEKPEAAALCRELGLGDALLGSNDSNRRHYVLHHGRLVPLPDGLLLFIPKRLWPVLTTSLLPLSTKLGLAVKWVASWRAAAGDRRDEASSPPNADESVESFVRRHFGPAVFENIAEPLLAGIFGGDATRLSARSTLPRLVQLEEKSPNLIRAFRNAGVPSRVRGTGPPSPPLFTTLRGGLGQMVRELGARLEPARVRLRARVLDIRLRPASPPGGTGYEICYGVQSEQGGLTLEADALILALPAYECGRLLVALDRALGEPLKAIPYASALTVSLGYESDAHENLPRGFGFLVPRKENRKLLACTFVHNKFPHRAPPGKALLRCFLGGASDPGTVDLRDDEIVSTVRAELQDLLGLCAEPLFCRIHRWPAAMPQYVVGHRDALERIRRQLEGHPGLFLAGNAYTGIGVPDCIREGKLAAERAVAHCCPGLQRD